MENSASPFRESFAHAISAWCMRGTGSRSSFATSITMSMVELDCSRAKFLSWSPNWLSADTVLRVWQCRKSCMENGP